MTKRMMVSLIAACAAGGACTACGQVILLRELMAVFQGNELSLGAILAAWLLWGACGSWLGGRLADRSARPAALFAGALALAAALLPASVVAVGGVRAVAGVGVEMVGFFTFTWISFALLGPLCFVQGGYFAISSRMLAKGAGTTGAGRAYFLESAGAAAGGLVLSLFVINLLPPVSLACLVGAVLACAAFALNLSAAPRPMRRACAQLAAIALIGGVCVAGVLSAWPDAARARFMWRPMRLLEARNSLHGNLAAVEIDGQPSIYEDGLISATSGSRLGAEELVHLGLAHHARPEAVLLIGGGLGGCLHEALKHNVLHLDYVELDPELIRMGRRHLLPGDLWPLSHESVHVKQLDARYHVKTTRSRYDAVLMDLPGPRSARLNRMYTLEFFTELKTILRPGGIVAFGVAGSEVHLSREQRFLLASLLKTAQAAFAHVSILPGETCLFILSDSPLAPPSAAAVLRTLAERDIATDYVGPNSLPAQLNAHKVAALMNVLEDELPAARVNTDANPVAYLYSLADWLGHFPGVRLNNLLWSVLDTSRAWFYAIPAAAVLLLGMVAGRKGRRPVGLAVAAGGLSQMVFQIAILISFQVLYGHMFYRVGVMVGLFMAGLAAGSLLFWRKSQQADYNANRLFLLVQAALCVYPLVIPLMFHMRPPSVLFMLLPAGAGVVGGVQLPLAVRILHARAGLGAGRAAGRLYGLDLLGSCGGALVAGPVLLPALGLAGICLWIAMVNAVVLLVLVGRD
ncbi:MAG TPA: fused MFS/spermidine synthase [Planctomycetota bacterium]|nr:fused MFS/spermidine synthase [Planctomycetota bacterium]